MDTYSLRGGEQPIHKAGASLNLEEATHIIVERARQLVGQMVTSKGNDMPPFLPEDFARMKGISKIEQADLGNTSAVLLKFHDGYVIKVNKNHHPVRQNFSCAHEIGHILFGELHLEHHLQSIEYRTFNPSNTGRLRSSAKERLCDIAATELLMPENVFRRYLSDFGASVTSIEQLARTFKVSIPAAAIRIAEISLRPCLTMLWQHQIKRGMKTLKLAWCTNPGISFSAGVRYLPVNNSVRYPSVLHQAYDQGNIVNCYRQFRHGGAVKRLLVESKGFGYGNTRYVISLAFLDN